MAAWSLLLECSYNLERNTLISFMGQRVSGQGRVEKTREVRRANLVSIWSMEMLGLSALLSPMASFMESKSSFLIAVKALIEKFSCSAMVLSSCRSSLHLLPKRRKLTIDQMKRTEAFDLQVQVKKYSDDNNSPRIITLAL